MPSDDATRLERLVRATPKLVGELDLDTCVQQVADFAQELLEARYAAVGLLDPGKTTLQSFTTAGVTPEEADRIGARPVGRGVLGLVIREGKVVRLPNLTEHPASVGFPPNHPPMKSFLGVPIVGRDGIVGDLYLTEKIGGANFSDQDVHLAALLAGIVASAVENARFHERTIHLLDEVQQLHRGRERFFAMVNHELRNSLAAVYGWAELMVRKKDPLTVPRGAFEVIEAAEQAIALVNDLLDLSRLDEDRLRPNLKDVDCCSVTRAAVQRVVPAASEKEILIEGPGRANPMLCRTDSHRVEQILVNLLTNAIRHAPEQSVITVSAAVLPPNVELRVLDRGPGVPADMAEKIFDIYYSTEGPEGRGSHGVGLALSRRLARLLGGDLRAVAQPGAGGLFVLTLPAVDTT